jgi:hypothetical protein
MNIYIYIDMQRLFVLKKMLKVYNILLTKVRNTIMLYYILIVLVLITGIAILTSTACTLIDLIYFHSTTFFSFHFTRNVCDLFVFFTTKMDHCPLNYYHQL